MSVISLTKGQNISLTKTDPSLSRLRLGLGWDANSFDGGDFDLDASAFMLTAEGKARSADDFLFYSTEGLKTKCGSLEHLGDNRTGAGDGDDEVIILDLTKPAADIEKIALVVSIYHAKARNQNFGMVSNAFVRIVNDDTGVEVARYDLTEDFSTQKSLVFAEIYRHNNEWKFKAVGNGFEEGLGAIGRMYSLPMTDEV
jgi:tellurium resistance protein TerD